MLAGYLGQWVKQPWSEDNDLVYWFLFVGLIVASLVIWLQILHYIVEEV